MRLGEKGFLMKLNIPDRAFAGYIFDLDGTLVDTMPLHFRAWQAELALHGCPFPESLFYAYGGVPARGVVERLNERFGLAMNSQAVAESKERRYVDLLCHVQPVKPVLDFMLGKHGQAKLAVATGSVREVADKTLASINLGQYFHAVVSADECKRGKPAPDVFLIAAARLGLSPEDCLVFEDAQPGIEAAKAAGMAWVHVPTAPVDGAEDE